jgi:hypothetical protein
MKRLLLVFHFSFLGYDKEDDLYKQYNKGMSWDENVDAKIFYLKNIESGLVGR